LIFISRSARSAQEQLCVEFRERQSYRTLCKEELCKVCIEQEERQEGEKNLFSRNPSDLSLTKSQKRKECMGNQNPPRIKLRRDSTFHKCRRDPIDGLEGGAKVEAFGYLENILSQRKSEAQEGERQWSLDHRFRGPTVIRSNQGA
jgi:hypothetical protein